MPGAAVETDILAQVSGSPNQHMARDPQAIQVGKAGMCSRVESIQEQVIDPRATKTTGRQADAVHDEQVDTDVRRAVVRIR